MIRYFWVLLYAITLHNSAYSQNSDYHLSDFYDNQHGLSQGTVNCIVQDKFGYLWFGTQDGLNRFDGINFTVHHPDPDHPNGISGNYIYSIIEDDTGDLWIGTRSAGLNRYDIETGIFEKFINQKNDSNSLSNNRVDCMVKGNSGEIWIGTNGGGLNRLDPRTKIFTRFLNDPEDNLSISSNHVQSLFMDKNNSLWVGTSRGLNKLDQLSGNFKRYKHNARDKASLSNDNILSLWGDQNQQLWIGTNGGGLNVMNMASESFRSYKHVKGDDLSLSHNAVRSILGADNGKIWVGTDGGYLNLFDPLNSKFTLTKVSFPIVRTIFKDRIGDFWVGIRGGVNRISKTKSKFTQYSKDNLGNLISTSGYVHAVCEDEDGYIWSGSYVDGLKRINRKTLEVKTYVQSENPNSISDTNIRFLFVDSEHTMWVGTRNGLNKYNRESDSFKVYLPDENDPFSIRSGRIGQMYEDSKGNLLIGTNRGFSIMDRKTEKFTNISRQAGGNSLYSNSVSSIMEGSPGIYWIGSASDGFDRYNSHTGEFTHYGHEADNLNSLSHDRISYIHDDNRGHLWIATYGGGLNKFDKSTEVFTHYNQKHGLTNNSLYCVIEDINGDLWMSHNAGISRFNIATETFKNYLEGMEFNSRGFHQGESGEIFLGSTAIVSFLPHDIVSNTSVPPVLIDEFKLFNELVTPTGNPGVIQQVMEETDTVVLRHDQNFFSFGFVSLNFVDSEKNKFKYKLENFDTEWNSTLVYPHANYTNVPPGEYIFKVIGSNNDNLWNDVGDSIYVKILSPWWGTMTFRITTVLLFIILLVIIFRLRLRNIKKQKAALEELVSIRTRKLQEHEAEIIEQNEQLVTLNEEKNELISIVSHDLKSPLDQIKGLVSLIKAMNPNLTDETNQYVDLINGLVERQRAMIGKVLDVDAIDAHEINLQITRIDINALIKEEVRTIQVIASDKGIELKLVLDKQVPHIAADRNYLIQVLENIISNAIKFSPPNKKVTLKTTQREGKVRVSIEDQGPGVSADDMKLIFESYSMLTAKPTGNEDSSGLGLSIVKKYMESMHANIWCESKEGKGAKFILEFDAK